MRNDVKRSLKYRRDDLVSIIRGQGLISQIEGPGDAACSEVAVIRGGQLSLGAGLQRRSASGWWYFFITMQRRERESCGADCFQLVST